MSGEAKQRGTEQGGSAGGEGAPRRAWWRAPMFSPVGFVLRAGVIAIAFAVMHGLGARAYVCVLSGTVPRGGSGAWPVFLACAYALTWFAAWIVAPVLVLAAALWAAARKIARGSGTTGIDRASGMR